MSDHTPKRQIFLSHASEDKPEVLKFAELLKSRPLAIENNIGIWVDKTDVTSIETYTSQFANALHDQDKICGFILYMPEKSAEFDGLKPWVEHEIEQALERRLRDKATKRVFPALYVYPGKRHRRLQPPPAIANWVSYESVYDDDEVADTILKGIVEGFARNGSQHSEPKPTEPQTGKIDALKSDQADSQWLMFSLALSGDQVLCKDESGTQAQCAKQALQALQLSPHHQHVLHARFPLLFRLPPDRVARIRLMTNDAELAMMPWAEWLSDYKVEVGPLQAFYRQGFESHAIKNPLVVIPANPEHDIAAGQHFTLLQGYFREYLGLDAVTRVTTVETLQHELQFNPPDLIYIYASLNQQCIQLDANDINQLQHQFSSVSLDQLGQWVAQAAVRPLLMANFAGEVVKHWPLPLIQGCRMLWIQSSAGHRKLNQLTQRFLEKLAELPQQPDLVQLINDNRVPVGINSRLWLNGQSPKLIGSNAGDLSGQLRLALLKVMLGRDTLKQSMYGFITDRNNIHDVMVYAVTGSKTACPFEFPAQLQQRLEDWDARGDEGIPVIPYYFSFTISDGTPSAHLMGQALDEGLLRYTHDPEEAFGRELKRRRLLNSYKCLMLNWSIRIQKGQEDSISSWLKIWGQTMRDELSGFIPAQSTLLHGLCIEVAEQGDAQSIQDQANDTIDSFYSYSMGLIENNEALGTLALREIRNFLNNPRWHTLLKLGQSPIDPNAYAKWVYETSNSGEFEHTVNTLWQQYQNNYQDYLQA